MVIIQKLLAWYDTKGTQELGTSNVGHLGRIVGDQRRCWSLLLCAALEDVSTGEDGMFWSASKLPWIWLKCNLTGLWLEDVCHTKHWTSFRFEPPIPIRPDQWRLTQSLRDSRSSHWLAAWTLWRPSPDFWSVSRLRTRTRNLIAVDIWAKKGISSGLKHETGFLHWDSNWKPANVDN